MINKSKLLCVSYFMKNIIIIIMKISMRKKKIITLINKKEINTIIITLIKKIKDFLKIKCKFNLKKKLKKIFINTKRSLFEMSIFEIKNNARLYLIINK